MLYRYIGEYVDGLIMKRETEKRKQIASKKKRMTNDYLSFWAVDVIACDSRLTIEEDVTVTIPDVDDTGSEAPLVATIIVACNFFVQWRKIKNEQTQKKERGRKKSTK